MPRHTNTSYFSAMDVRVVALESSVAVIPEAISTPSKALDAKMVA